MKLFSGALVVFLALAISSVAAFFSVTGLATLFMGVFLPVIIMGTVLEIGKLVAAWWLHANWRNTNVSMLHKAYLGLAVAALMLITAIGVYGYLAKGFLNQQTPLDVVKLQIAQREQQITVDQERIKRLNDRQNQLDAAVNSLIDQKYVMNSQRLRAQQKSEREQIATDLESTQKDIDRLNIELLPLKMSSTDVEAKLGPIKYVAELFGWQKPDIAVRMVILILMFAFDPLAVVLVLSGSISISEWMAERPRKQRHPDPFEPMVLIRRLKQDYNIQVERMTDSDKTDKQRILEILRRNPDSIEEVVDTVIDWYESQTDRT